MKHGSAARESPARCPSAARSPQRRGCTDWLSKTHAAHRRRHSSPPLCKPVRRTLYCSTVRTGGKLALLRYSIGSHSEWPAYTPARMPAYTPARMPGATRRPARTPRISSDPLIDALIVLTDQESHCII